MLEKTQLEYVTNNARAGQRALALCTQPVLGLDIETTGLDPLQSRIRLLQVATKDGRIYVFDLDQVDINALAPLFRVPMVAHNAGFEYRHLTNAGINPDPLHDSMLLGRLTQHELQSLADLSRDMLGITLDKSEQVSDWSAGDLSTEQIEYAGIDALATLRLLDTLLPKVDRAGQRPLYRTWIHALPVLSDLQLEGQRFDWETHGQLLETWIEKQQRLLVQLRIQLGPINPNSGPQLGQWLTDNLDSKVIAKWPKTPKGRLKTDASTLQLFADLPAIMPLLTYKQVSKLISTYGTGYAKHRHPVTGRLHAEFRLGNTRSGRVAVSRPNTQNPPRLADFRKLFIPGPGRCFVGADYSQIELRIAALLSRDPEMIAAYKNGEDLHRKTAAAVAGVAPDQITKEQRQAAKAINFGTLYGQGPAGLAKTAKLDYGADMTLAEARQSLRRFSLAYPLLAYWQRQQVATAEMCGQVRTRMGLIRDFDVQGKGYLRGESQNIPVQGSAAEVLLTTISKLPASLAGIDARLAHNVHDEIILDVAPGDTDRAEAALRQCMVDGFLTVFPEGEALTHDLVDVFTGQNWNEVH
jgi:DNA polymerase-1